VCAESGNIFKRLLRKILTSRQVQLIRIIRDYLWSTPCLLWQECRLISRAIHYRHCLSPTDTVRLSALRTAAHILDKSLRARPWECGRGKKAYDDCVQLTGHLEDSILASDPSYLWARSVMRAHEQSQIRGSPIVSSDSLPDFTQEDRERVFSALKGRRSVRSFLARPIDDSIIQQIIVAASWAPSSCCRQSAFFYIAREPHSVQECLNLCAGATCFSDNVPCFISVCADQRSYEARDRHLPIIDATLAVQNLLLAAHTYGLEGTILNWMHATYLEERHLRELLSIPDYHRVVMNIAMGYPTSVPSAPVRKSLDLTFMMCGPPNGCASAYPVNTCAAKQCCVG
jgi:nitroreductase